MHSLAIRQIRNDHLKFTPSRLCEIWMNHSVYSEDDLSLLKFVHKRGHLEYRHLGALGTLWMVSFLSDEVAVELMLTIPPGYTLRWCDANA